MPKQLSVPVTNPYRPVNKLFKRPEYIPRKPQNIREYKRDHKPVFLAPYETEVSKDYDFDDSV